MSSSSSQTHYEVQGKKSGAWEILKISNEENNAIAAAKKLFTERSLTSVKVVRVKFDDSDGVFRDRVVFVDGVETNSTNSTNSSSAKTSGSSNRSAKGAPLEVIRPICQSASDVYGLEARQAISILLAKPLEGWQITPLELLYHQKHMQKLNDTGQILQGAVQRVAISQVQETGQKAQERVLELYAFATTALDNLKTIVKEEPIPIVEQDDLLALLDATKKTSDWRKFFMMSMAFHLQDKKTLDDKHTAIFEYLSKYDNPEILEMLDRYLADFLLSSKNLNTLIGNETDVNLGNKLLSLIDFVKGEREDQSEMNAEAQRVSQLLKEKLLPETRLTLIRRLNDILSGSESFDKDDLLNSMRYPSLLLARLRITESEFIGGRKAVDALSERSERMSGNVTIGSLLEGIDSPLNRVERLLIISEGMVGPETKRIISNHIISILDNTYNTKTIVSSNDGALAIVARLKELQTMVEKSGFPELYSTKISGLLDGVGVEALIVNGVFGVLTKEAEDRFHLSLTLLQMISEESLTEPGCAELVHDFIRRTVYSTEFMDELEDKAMKGDDRVDQFRRLYTLIERPARQVPMGKVG
jgi:hypothetical protein